MTKHVAVIASGETERRSLPHLVSHLKDCAIEVSVRIPPGNGKLTPAMAEKLIKSLFYGGLSPDKVVILIDLDGKDPDQALNPFRTELPERLRNQGRVNIQYSYAQWHLEAWYFGDAQNLRAYLGGQAPGHVDTSHPDRIENPKNHLKNLLGDRRYTAVVSEEIAKNLDSQEIARHSPSFSGFLKAIQNGTHALSEV